MRTVHGSLPPVVVSSPVSIKRRGSTHVCADLALARRAVAREAAAWKEIFSMAQALLNNVAWRYGLDASREDLLQDVMLRLLRKIHTYRGESPLRVWVASVCYNCLRNAYRATLMEQRVIEPASVDDVEHAAPTSADSSAIRRSELSLVIAALAALCEAHRNVVVLRVVAERSVDEAARMLAVPAGTVKSRLSRALVDLRLFVLVLQGVPIAAAAQASGISLSVARERVATALPAWRRRLPESHVTRMERRLAVGPVMMRQPAA